MLAYICPSQAVDCSAGCDITAASPVCGADGLTYAAECLATCSGATTVVSAGFCPFAKPPAAPSPAAPTDAPAAPAATAEEMSAAHPIARFFAATGAAAAAAAAAPRIATAAEMKLFAAEGFALVGAARMANAAGDAAADNARFDAEAEVRAAAIAANSPVEVFDIRVVPETGLMYVRKNPIRGGAADLAGAGATVGERSVRGKRGHGLRARGSPVAAAAEDSSGSGDGGKQGPVYGWAEIQDLPNYPQRAIGLIEIRDRYQRVTSTCTGAMIGNYATTTAAHCLIYGPNNFAPYATFAAGAFLPRNAGTQPYLPWGTVGAAYYAYLSAWLNTPKPQGWIYDIAAMVLREDVGSASGFLGYSWNVQGYRGRLYAAGYPATARTRGQFYELAGICNVADPNGNDGQLLFKSSPPPPSCPGGCAPAVINGQSGQPAYEVRASNGGVYIRGVLSRAGPSSPGCPYDIYTEIDQNNFSFLNMYKNAVPQQQ